MGSVYDAQIIEQTLELRSTRTKLTNVYKA